MRTDLAPALIEKLKQSQLVIAPTLFHSEIADILWKYVRFGELDKETALARYAEAIGLVDIFEADEQLPCPPPFATRTLCMTRSMPSWHGGTVVRC